MSFFFTAVYKLVVCATLFFATVTVSAQDFVGYEGRNAVKEGDGGAKKTVEGIDFWSDGEPPRKYKLLGYITDNRLKSGLFGKISMGNLESNVAAVAKKNGGDAVISIGAEAETVGAVGNAFANGSGNNTTAFGMASRIQRQNSKFAVVQYVNEPAAPIAVQKAEPASDGAVAAPTVPAQPQN